MQVDQLTDSSAIAYIRITDKKYSLLEASGKYTGMQPIYDGSYSQLGYGETRDRLASYFLDGKDIDMWDDYVYYIKGKEVIVPVSIDGKLVGYIFRGVIER
jgi:hypothetical protein